MASAQLLTPFYLTLCNSDMFQSSKGHLQGVRHIFQQQGQQKELPDVKFSLLSNSILYVRDDTCIQSIVYYRRYWNAVYVKMFLGFKAIKFLAFCTAAIQCVMPVCFVFR